MKVEILRRKCVGSGNCAEQAAHVFGQDAADGKVVLLGGDLIPEDEAVRQAAALCPVGAILIDGSVPE